MMNCIIVDDEPLSQNVLKRYIADCHDLNLLTVCSNSFEANEFVNTTCVDLIFLDINMPKLSGINLARSLINPPLIIFTTAYPEFAVEGFNLDAVDYLLKPFSFERFLKAVNKARKIYMRQEENATPHEEETILLKSGKRIFKVKFSDIYLFESAGDYVKVFTNNGTIVICDTLKNLTGQLPENFIRVHKSFIISLKEVKFIEGNMVKILDKDVPVGAVYREGLIKHF